jgi:type VI secretion system protein ImpK
MPVAAPRRTETLAGVFQEVLTATVRLRTGRLTPPTAESYRAQIRHLLGGADQDAQRQGYTREDARLAAFACVAFLDESILNLHNPLFADWPRKPLQEELFGGHTAGEMFFQTLDRLMARPQSEDTVDILEVFALALLLGYRGRYGMGGQAELRSLLEGVVRKIRLVRPLCAGLTPDWPPRAESVVQMKDPWVRRLAFVAIGCVALAVVLLLAYWSLLGAGVTDLGRLGIVS